MKQLVKSLLAMGVLSIAAQSFAAPANPTTSNNMTPAERTKIEAVVHDYLLQKPEVLVQALQILQQRQYQEAEKTVKQTQHIAGTYANSLFRQGNDPVAGNPNGKVTIVEFFDYQCPHCVDMAPVFENIIKANPQVRIVFKDFPIRGPLSEFVARAALAANKQGKYYEFNHAVLTSTQPLTQENVLVIAKNVGLDVNRLKKDMDDSSVKDQLKSNVKLAQDLKIFGTPAIFIGKTDATGNNGVSYFPGQIDQSQLQTMIDKTNQ